MRGWLRVANCGEGAVAHYIKGVKAAGTDDADKVQPKIREIPVDDFTGHGKQVRAVSALLATLVARCSTETRNRLDPE